MFIVDNYRIICTDTDTSLSALKDSLWLNVSYVRPCSSALISLKLPVFVN